MMLSRIQDIINKVKTNPRNDVLAEAILILFSIVTKKHKVEKVQVVSDDGPIKKMIANLVDQIGKLGLQVKELNKKLEDQGEAYVELAKHVKQLDSKIAKLEKDINRIYNLIFG